MTDERINCLLVRSGVNSTEGPTGIYFLQTLLSILLCYLAYDALLVLYFS